VALAALLWVSLTATNSGTAAWRVLGWLCVAILLVALAAWIVRQGWRAFTTSYGGLLIGIGLVVALFADKPWLTQLGWIGLGIGLILAWML
jgi:hypothetical protein